MADGCGACGEQHGVYLVERPGEEFGVLRCGRCLARRVVRLERVAQAARMVSALLSEGDAPESWLTQLDAALDALEAEA